MDKRFIKLEVPKKDLSGIRYGKLVVTGFAYWKEDKNPTKYGRTSRKAWWNTKCDCGNDYALSGVSLSSGTRSCGCYITEFNRAKAKKVKEDNQALKLLYQGYKSGAKNRNYSFELSLEQFQELTSQNCYLCENPPANIKKHYRTHATHLKDYVYNGIDRFDNSIGYVYENCKSCCYECNISKSDRDIKSYIAHMRRVLNNVDSNKELLDLVSEDIVEYKILNII